MTASAGGGTGVPEQAVPAISTPDRRVRVFVSSTLQELADERAAARRAIAGLRLTPVLFELGARPHPPRELYRAYLAQSDVFVGIYWQRYGWVAPGERVSGLEDEYLLSGERPKLIYVKHPAGDREPALTELLHRVQADDRASYKPFSDAAELADLLANDLAVLLTERFAATPPPVSAPDLRPARLPVPPTALVGRGREVAAVGALLDRDDVRLVSVVGPGGIGKTRLGLEVAAARRAAGDDVWFVDLAPLTDARLVLKVVAEALGLRGDDARPVLDLLIERLGDRPLLLVLDNFEHLLPAARELQRLLARCPGLKALVTTRTVLGLRGEHELALAPLAVPTRDELAAITASPAVELFVARARDVRPDFAIDEGNARDVAEICRRLDGIPLAIEVAAARARLLNPAALRARLTHVLDLHAEQVDLPGRQRTLRATVEWSHGLLGEEQRALLARLAVFAGGWTLEAAEAVGAVDGDIDVLETLSSLVAQSLVTTSEGDDPEPRFRMLAPVREFALEQLRERGEDDATHRRAAAYLRDFAVRAGAGLSTRDNRTWLARVDSERQNLRDILNWLADADEAELEIRIAAPLGVYFWIRGMLGQMLELAERTAALPSAEALPPDARALLLWTRGTVRIELGRFAEAVPFLDELVPQARALGDVRLLANSLYSKALTLSPDTERDAMRALFEEALGLCERSGDDWGVAFVMGPLGQLEMSAGHADRATQLHRRMLAKAEGIANDHLVGQAHNALGLDLLMAGDVDGARAEFLAAADICQRLGDQEGLAYCLEGFAGLALAAGSATECARLLGAASHAREVIGVSVWPLLRPLSAAFAQGVRATLGDEVWRREFAAGRRLHGVEALAFARGATAVPS